MLTDPIADFLTRIRNASDRNIAVVQADFSKIKMSVGEMMKKYGFIKDIKMVEEEGKQWIEVELVDNKKISIKRISKPGRRIYLSADMLPTVKSGLGIAIISTSKGIMTNKEAKKMGIGGEMMCEVY